MVSVQSAPERAGNPFDRQHSTPGRRRIRLATLLGFLTVMCALIFPFAPVQQSEARYQWPTPDHAATATAIPLVPYRPLTLTASFSCAAVSALRTAGPGPHVVLSTTPPHADPGTKPLSGLSVVERDGSLQLSSDGRPITATPLAAAETSGSCVWRLRSDQHETVLQRDDNTVAQVAGDVRPAVAGAFTDAGTTRGLAMTVLADTRFQTSPTPIKLALAIGCLAGLAGMLLALGGADRMFGTRAIRILPVGWWRPRPVDLAVIAASVLWMFIGPITIDDGYIAGMVRSVGSNGFIGNVYHWLNAPEAPFSWFYELYYLWSRISAHPVWMRVPSTLLCLLSWSLLSRLVLPRLGPFHRRAAVRRLAAAAFLVWWMPFDLSLRPEPWVAAGALAVWCLVERALAARTVRPLVCALVIAAATVAVTPGGILALAPLVCAALPLLRLLRGRRDVWRLALCVVLIAAPSCATVLMFADQSFGAVLEAVRVRELISGGMPWYQEFQRYQQLLDPEHFDGALPRRTPVLVTVAGAAAVCWTLWQRSRGRRCSGLASPPTARLVGTFVVGLASLVFTPTKWTQHFGSLAGIGAAVLVVFLYAWSRRQFRVTRARELLAGVAIMTVVAWAVLAGRNLWPAVSDEGLAWNTIAPQLGGVRFSRLSLVLGGAFTAILAIIALWRVRGGRPAWPVRWRPWLPTAATVAALLVIATLALNLYSFSKAGFTRRHIYTIADGAFSPSSCGIEDAMRLELDPAHDGLPPASPGTPPTVQPALPVAGAELPGWTAEPTGPSIGGSRTPFRTAWYRLSADQRQGRLPVVISTDGGRGRLTAEFQGDQGPGPAPLPLDVQGSPAPGKTMDARVIAPRGATMVRIAAVADEPLTISVPRSPALTPMTAVLPRGTSAIMDWPVAFVLPCLQPAPLANGVATIPPWRVAPPRPDDEAGVPITYAPDQGGPFAGPRLLVHQTRIPVYLRGEPTREPAQLLRWSPTATPEPADSTPHTIPGWQDITPLTVPGRP